MLDRAARWQVTHAPAMPVEALALGRPPEEVAELLPRLFNLCRAAQSAALCQALNLPAPDTAPQDEIIRDHLLKLYVTWPRLMDQAPRPLPNGWQEGGEALLAALVPMGFPDTPAAFAAAVEGRCGIGAVLADLATLLPAGMGAFVPLPHVDETTAFDPMAAVENSVAGRQANHPVMRRIEAQRGRDLFWRATARLYDLADACRGALPAPQAPAPGSALVAATRGTYAVRAAQSGGVVTALARVTPTDHLLAPGGVLASTLAAVLDGQDHLVPLVMDILDPCQPVEVKEVHHA